MNAKQLAEKYKTTVTQIQREWYSFLENEGYDEAGRVYETFGAWLDRKSVRETCDPYDGGRGSGTYGTED